MSRMSHARPVAVVSVLVLAALGPPSFARAQPVTAFAPHAREQPSPIERFRPTLERYGGFHSHPRYGEVWSPSPGMVPAGWRPYPACRWDYDEARRVWLFNDSSPWGEIVHHYGRWASDPALGWIWIAGAEFGPGWVAWRFDAQSVSWAALPPEQGGQPAAQAWHTQSTDAFNARCREAAPAPVAAQQPQAPAHAAPNPAPPASAVPNRGTPPLAGVMPAVPAGAGPAPRRQLPPPSTGGGFPGPFVPGLPPARPAPAPAPTPTPTPAPSQTPAPTPPPGGNAGPFTPPGGVITSRQPCVGNPVLCRPASITPSDGHCLLNPSDPRCRARAPNPAEYVPLQIPRRRPTLPAAGPFSFFTDPLNAALRAQGVPARIRGGEGPPSPRARTLPPWRGAATRPPPAPGSASPPQRPQRTPPSGPVASRCAVAPNSSLCRGQPPSSAAPPRPLPRPFTGPPRPPMPSHASRHQAHRTWAAMPLSPPAYRPYQPYRPLPHMAGPFAARPFAMPRQVARPFMARPFATRPLVARPYAARPAFRAAPMMRHPVARSLAAGRVYARRR